MYNQPSPPNITSKKENPQNQHKTLERKNEEMNQLYLYNPNDMESTQNSTTTHNHMESTTQKKKNCPNLPPTTIHRPLPPPNTT